MRKAAYILALATAGATLATTTVPAMAQEQQQVAVKYGDLNLNSPAGRETLQARINAAARRMCGPIFSPSPLDRMLNDACRAEVTDKANSQVFAALGSSSGIRAAR